MYISHCIMLKAEALIFFYTLGSTNIFVIYAFVLN